MFPDIGDVIVGEDPTVYLVPRKSEDDLQPHSSRTLTYPTDRDCDSLASSSLKRKRSVIFFPLSSFDDDEWSLFLDLKVIIKSISNYF